MGEIFFCVQFPAKMSSRLGKYIPEVIIGMELIDNKSIKQVKRQVL
jgi:hypothetical protein